MQNLILKPLKETQAITVLVLIKTGSRYETNKNQGTAHFIEHLLFKGTKKRPNSLAITKELDGVGAEYNAFTAKDRTGFYIKIAKEHLELALDILSDMLFNSKFDAKEIKKERGVILEEINMYFDNPLMFIDSLLESSVYQGHDLGRLVSGRKEVVRKISRTEILKFYKKYYIPKDLIIGLSGNFNKKSSVNLIKKYFKITNFDIKNNFRVFKSKQTKPRVVIYNKSTDQVQTAIGFKGVSYKDNDFYSLKLLSLILGGNMSSRLFLKIREQMGLCYYIRSNSESYQDTGILSITAGLDKLRIKYALKAIFLELDKLKSKKVTNIELKRAKEFIKGKLILKLEDSANVVDWYCEQLLLQNTKLNSEQILKRFNKVTINDIFKVANKILKKETVNLAIIGSFKNRDKQRFKSIINI